MTALKPWTILLAWEEDWISNSGTYGWTGIAADETDAVDKARTAGLLEQWDASDIASSSPEDLDAMKPSTQVLFSHEGANIWAANDMLAALKECRAALGSCVNQIKQMRGMFGDEDGAIQNALDDAEVADSFADETIAVAECRDGAA